MIELNKVYKDRSGNDVRIICVDRQDDTPIVGLLMMEDGEYLACYTAGGQYIPDEPSANDLILPEDFRAFQDGEPVMVRDFDYHEWRQENFAGVDSYGRAITWTNGTKWASDGETEHWKQCRRPTKKELE